MDGGGALGRLVEDIGSGQLHGHIIGRADGDGSKWPEKAQGIAETDIAGTGGQSQVCQSAAHRPIHASHGQGAATGTAKGGVDGDIGADGGGGVTEVEVAAHDLHITRQRGADRRDVEALVGGGAKLVDRFERRQNSQVGG